MTTEQQFKKINMRQMVFIAMHQTRQKAFYKEFTSLDAAEKYAKARAVSGNVVAVFGPQNKVFKQPDEPVCEMELDFID